MPVDGGRRLPKLIEKSAALVDVLAVRVLGCQRLMRAPILLYRSGFGFPFGPRMPLVEHVGRRSGFGTRSQWFHNVGAHPEVWISTGLQRRQHATAEILSSTPADVVLRDYRRRQPVAGFVHRPV